MQLVTLEDSLRQYIQSNSQLQTAFSDAHNKASSAHTVTLYVSVIRQSLKV